MTKDIAKVIGFGLVVTLLSACLIIPRDGPPGKYLDDYSCEQLKQELERLQDPHTPYNPERELEIRMIMSQKHCS